MGLSRPARCRLARLLRDLEGGGLSGEPTDGGGSTSPGAVPRAFGVDNGPGVLRSGSAVDGEGVGHGSSFPAGGPAEQEGELLYRSQQSLAPASRRGGQNTDQLATSDKLLPVVLSDSARTGMELAM
jgi:hypothetical protein